MHRKGTIKKRERMTVKRKNISFCEKRRVVRIGVCDYNEASIRFLTRMQSHLRELDSNVCIDIYTVASVETFLKMMDRDIEVYLEKTYFHPEKKPELRKLSNARSTHYRKLSKATALFYDFIIKTDLINSVDSPGLQIHRQLR